MNVCHCVLRGVLPYILSMPNTEALFMQHLLIHRDPECRSNLQLVGSEPLKSSSDSQMTVDSVEAKLLFWLNLNSIELSFVL